MTSTLHVRTRAPNAEHRLPVKTYDSRFTVVDFHPIGRSYARTHITESSKVGLSTGMELLQGKSLSISTRYLQDRTRKIVQCSLPVIINMRILMKLMLQ